ncbi:MAG: sulfite exporter TauE/SafE family protein, partial [Rhodobacterales bacterium]|nr:sulfite exporter TauE/SafE family protein [Rhodobacterales bacterium]
PSSWETAAARAAVAGALVVNLPPALVQIGVGLFVIWSVFLSPPPWLRRFPMMTGAFSSFLTMFFGATGPFVATFTKSLKLDRHGHVATHGAMMSAQHLLKTAMFAILGFAAAMIAAGAVGTTLGRLVLNRMSDCRFRLALDVVLILLSLRLIWGGLSML